MACGRRSNGTQSRATTDRTVRRQGRRRIDLSSGTTTAVAVTGLIQWLFVALAFWVDDHRAAV